MSEDSVESTLLRVMPYGALQMAARLLAIDDLAAGTGIACRSDELQAAADRFRSERGLLTYKDTADWLWARGLTIKNWQRDISTTLLEEKLRGHAVIAAAAKAQFEASPGAFRKINVGVVVVEDEGIAHEILILLDEERTRFDIVAKRYSILFADGVSAHPTSRRTLFAHQAPSPISAIALAEGFSGPKDAPPLAKEGLWYIYRVYSVEDPIFDRETRAHARALVLEDALAPHIVRRFAGLLDRLGCPCPSTIGPSSLLTAEEQFRASLRLSRSVRTMEAVLLERMVDAR